MWTPCSPNVYSITFVHVLFHEVINRKYTFSIIPYTVKHYYESSCSENSYKTCKSVSDKSITINSLLLFL